MMNIICISPRRLSSNAAASFKPPTERMQSIVAAAAPLEPADSVPAEKTPQWRTTGSGRAKDGGSAGGCAQLQRRGRVGMLSAGVKKVRREILTHFLFLLLG